MSRKTNSDAAWAQKEWTGDDVRTAKPAAELPEEVLKAFAKTRGKQKAPAKVPISIRLSEEVVDHYRATGPDGRRASMRRSKRRSSATEGLGAGH